MKRKQRIISAARHLKAVMIHGRGYAYYDDGTRSWWVSSADDMAELGRMLAIIDLDNYENPYSRWCAGHLAREMPHGADRWLNRRKVAV